MPTILQRASRQVVGTRSLSSGAHSRDPVALPPYEYRASSSCPGVSRASTSCLVTRSKDVDGRDKPGHDVDRPVAIRQRQAERLRQILHMLYGLRTDLLTAQAPIPRRVRDTSTRHPNHF